MDSKGQPVQIAPSAALHQKADKYESLATQVLEQLNRPDNRDEVIKEILFRVQAVSGIQAVGIRLQEGEDFPYGEALGFSKDFVAAENSLCARDQTGEILRDAAGKPVLECLCGTVLRGSTDPSRPFFTNGGSFWTNSTTAFLATAAGKNRPSRARMRCNGRGYESVALIPVRSDRKIVGLLQLNDPQKNFFTPSLIHFFESISSSIGFFLKIRQAEEILLQFLQGRPPLVAKPSFPSAADTYNYHHLHQFAPISIWEEDFSEIKAYFDKQRKRGVTDFRSYFDAHPEAILSLASKVRILKVNPATLALFHAQDENSLYQGLHAIFNKESYDVFKEELIALAEGKSHFNSIAVNRTLTGDAIHVLLKLIVPPGYARTLSRVFVFIIDITAQIEQQADLIKSEEKYRQIIQTAPDAILVADIESGIIIEANTKAEEILGRSAQEIIGMHLTELPPPEQATAYKKILLHHIKQGGAVSENLVVCNKKGDRIPVSVSSSILSWGGRKYITGFFRKKGNNNDIVDHPLTMRECEILRLIASGLSAKQIATRCHISDKTVRKHRSNMMKKLNVHKTAELVNYAINFGIIDPNGRPI